MKKVKKNGTRKKEVLIGLLTLILLCICVFIFSLLVYYNFDLDLYKDYLY